MNQYHSDVSGFYNLSIKQRLALLKELVNLNEEELNLLSNLGYFRPNQINSTIENVVGSYQLPLGLAFNFKINNKDYIIPMVIEEPSVIAGASNAAKIARKLGGFQSEQVKSIMISQIQLTNVKNVEKLKTIIKENEQEILDLANQQDPLLNQLGGGAIRLETRYLKTKRSSMVIVHLLVDVLDAMGANIVNTMAEAVSPFIEQITETEVNLRILSNLSTYRIAKSRAVFDKDLLGGDIIVEKILDALDFANADPFRATTHNKGIMNGITALALATGNDTRAIEAGAHAYASLTGSYRSLTSFQKDETGNLIGEIELPLAFGIIGGMTKNHPGAELALKILRVKSAQELSQVAAALGLAQNVAALKALVSEGIQKGHMELHSKNIAKLAGVPENLIDKVASQLIKDNKIRVDYAKELWKRFEKEKS